MKPVDSGGAAAPLKIMIQKPGDLSVERWAKLTADMIATPADDCSKDKLKEAKELQDKIFLILRNAFGRLTVIATLEVIDNLARQSAEEVVSVAGSSSWAENFKYPAIASAIEDLIRRNLFSAVYAVRPTGSLGRSE